MTREEWTNSDNGLAMLLVPGELAWKSVGPGSDYPRYCLACCRKIWKLLPDEYSRQSVEVAERHNVARATRQEWERARYNAEGAYINLQGTGHNLDEHPEAETVKRWIDEVASIPLDEVRQMIRTKSLGEEYPPAKLLEAAAGFVWFSVCCYEGWGTKTVVETRTLIEYAAFLPAPLLREMVGNPFCPA